MTYREGRGGDLGGGKTDEVENDRQRHVELRKQLIQRPAEKILQIQKIHFRG